MILQITGTTTLLGLIGTPVAHSRSPQMYNYCFQKYGLDYAYLAFDITPEQIGSAVNAIRTLHMRGANVTMPCKAAVIPFLDRITPAAKAIGAVNTIVNDNGVLTGHNTDGIGFVQNLRERGVEVSGKHMVILGAGGAATAICVQAALDGAQEIAIFNRADEFYANGEKTVEKLSAAVPACKVSIHPLEGAEALADAVRACSLLVNATKVGMKPLDGQTLVNAALLHKELVVCDTVYNPRKTLLIEQAEQAGCKAIGGIGMLLWQGVAAFKLFTGRDMPTQEVLETFFS